MHWFWRAFIAFLAGWVVEAFVRIGIAFLLRIVSIQTAAPMVVGISIIGFSLSLVVALAVYGLLSRRYDSRRMFERETRCRKCGYVLRGISEPRCPECGERI